ncbi:glycine zipper 2TM protein [Acidovorax sp. 62]|uniref:glycine zipper 2TM domain-containing protein n=1 Tax=Acidovorax sp. 62 TaxID=2035203 RepID=UPI000C4559B3|nr:glycine zipper 2TM domain-containing protein [Acidovorax sp. 62]PIF92862.1 glycine zipper 2TM protein [Acidovorax sp. 62]
MHKANTLSVQPATPMALPGAAGAPGALKWMWVAIGGLGACVVALATVLVVQHTGTPGAEAAAPGAQPATLVAGPGGLAAPALGSSLQAQPAGQGAQGLQGAGFPAPSGAPVAVAPVGGQPRPVAQQGGAWPEPAPNGAMGNAGNVGTPVAQRSVSICKTCGQVESVQAIEQAAPATGVGAVAGGVLGAVVGNQIGKGNGRTAATVLGAVGGGYAGHQIEKRTRTQTTYQVRVRMEDGSSRVFTRAQPPAVGTPVVLQGKGFRVADERAMPQAQQPQPQYQTVSQPGYVAMQQ